VLPSSTRAAVLAAADRSLSRFMREIRDRRDVFIRPAIMTSGMVRQQQLAGQAEPTRRLWPRRLNASGWSYGHCHDIRLDLYSGALPETKTGGVRRPPMMCEDCVPAPGAGQITDPLMFGRFQRLYSKPRGEPPSHPKKPPQKTIYSSQCANAKNPDCGTP